MRDAEVTRIGSDPDAFEAFYREHIEAVLRFVSRRVDDPYLAADLAAEVFLAAIESVGTYRPKRGAQIAWLYGIARHVVAGERRRAGRELDARTRFGARRLVEPDDVARLEERLDAETSARRVCLAMDGLSERERAVLELVALDGLTVAEAAAALRISQVSARVRLHRARRNILIRLPSDAGIEAMETTT